MHFYLFCMEVDLKKNLLILWNTSKKPERKKFTLKANKDMISSQSNQLYFTRIDLFHFIIVLCVLFRFLFVFNFWPPPIKFRKK